jgi:hypothetical protein
MSDYLPAHLLPVNTYTVLHSNQPKGAMKGLKHNEVFDLGTLSTE